MGLRDTFKDAALTAFNAVGDVAVSANYHAHASSTYDTSAGTNVAAFTTVAGVKVIFEVFQLAKIDGTIIQPEDKLALIPVRHLSAITPKLEDKLVVSGVTWAVKNVQADPAEAVYSLQVRRP